MDMRKLLFIGISVLAYVLVAGTIDLSNLYNYANQTVPAYIVKDNTGANAITNAGATLGRVLFYDKKLSANGTISCSSCHRQKFAFGDSLRLSVGLTGGPTGRHSMRLINSRFATETRFFWDERATSLEDQTTRPIQDHIEMGFSGTNGDPAIDSLIRKLEAVDYYQTLFTQVYGSPVITEDKMQRALAQFIRSIQSFDSKFDAGRAQVANDAAPFPNYSADENAGKLLFLNPPNQGGAGCQGCHRAPEFDIDPNSKNNGVIGVAGDSTLTDLTNTRAPSLRDLFNPNGTLNGPLMHTGNFNSIDLVIQHYNQVPQNPNNTNLDARVSGPGGNLQLTQQEKDQLVAFLKTLSGNDVYTNVKWSNPFDVSGNLTVIYPVSVQSELTQEVFNLYPNPASLKTNIELVAGNYQVQIMNSLGQTEEELFTGCSLKLDVSNLTKGVYWVKVTDLNKQEQQVKRLRVE
jgi:cytochrome c peroxidase